ncbi:MAG: 3D domain-containing protein [Candidatus Gracilibacteria bacterium]|nr:3D domain-containing protein [Candidatus Gracilibacteria bacterium]
MISRLLNKVTNVGIIFLITFTQVYSLTGDTNSNNKITTNKKIKIIKEINLVVTGYYSPLPNQESYITGSYEDEIRLNGDGVGMASGKKVYTGAIAAPKTYDFGTKIYIDGYGVGVVEDRGGAIIDDEDTRIDIWMGAGDEGLQRAKNWGSKKLKGYIVDSNSKITLEFKTGTEDSYKKLSLNPESSKEDIQKVQEYFKEIGFYDGEIDGVYENIKPIIIKYQIQKGIIVSENDDSAGYFGPKTIKYLSEDFGLGIKYENNLSKIEREHIKIKINALKNKLGSKYNTKIQKTIKDIKKLKTRTNLDKKTKAILDYLEIIL